MDYTQYDYNALVNRISTLVKNSEGWGDGYMSSTGQTLIQLIAQMTDELNYMLERRTQENFLPTALLPSSVLSLASSLSYRPRRMVSARGMMDIQLTDREGYPVQPQGTVTIPKYTKISYKNSNFVNVNEISIKTGETNPVSFQAMEGIQKSQTFSVTNTSGNLYQHNYILLKNYQHIEENSLLVYDSDGSYTDVETQVGIQPSAGAISFSGPNDKVYDIRITNDGMVILFGNNTFGKKPDKDITVSWIESSGASVDIQAQGLSFDLTSPTVTDNLGLTPPNEYYYTITNTSAITNGLNNESISDIKKRAPDYVRSANRAVIEADYEFWIKHSGVGGIIDSRVYGQQETGIDVINMNNIYGVYLNENGTSLSTADINNLSNYLDTYKEVTANIILQQAEIVPLQINLIVHRNKSLSIADSEVFDIMKGELQNYFAFVQGSLGGSLHYSKLVKTLHEYTTTKNGQIFRVADYVNISLRALKPFSMPAEFSTNTISIAAGTAGDNYTLTVNGTDYTYTMVSGDTATSIASGMASALSSVPNLTATTNAGTLTLTAASGTSYTLSNTASTHPTNIPVSTDIQLIAPTIAASSTEVFARGYVEIIHTDGTVVATDDSNGAIGGGIIDYKTGKLNIPVLASGNYYVRYLQNSDMNFTCNPNAALTYSLPKQTYATSQEQLSTITVVS